MITTSTGLSLVARPCGARSATFILPRGPAPADDLLQALRLGAPGGAVVRVDVAAVVHLRAGKTDHLPSRETGVAAVHRVAENAFDRVRAQQRKERRALDRREFSVLLLRCE